MIYQAEVTATEVQPPPALPITTKETYTGLSKPPFKSRLGGHKHEKWHILFKPEGATLNKRLEVFSNCRHKASLVLDPSSVEPD